MKLAAILFDIDDTLCATTLFAQRARQNAVRAMIAAGLDVPEEVVLAELGEVISEFSSNYEHHFDKLLLRLGRAALPRQNEALVVAAGVAAYHDTKFHELTPIEGVPELLADLRTAGLRIGIVTHGWAVKQAEKLVRLGLVPFFDPRAIFISDEIGISKPNPKLYALAVRSLSLVPEQVMYVGDSPQNDIAPPNSLGMITTWARRYARSPQPGAEPASEDTVPNHEIWDFDELRTILRDEYGVALPGPGERAGASAGS